MYVIQPVAQHTLNKFVQMATILQNKSTFPWSPPTHHRDPMRRELKIDPAVNDLYPNCDANVWLRSCEQEITEPIYGKQSGRIPPWLNGCLIRNGPGSLKVGASTFEHLFDSSALLHRFAIANGTVTYQCRFLQSETYRKNHAARRIVVTEFGTRAVLDPCRGIFERVAAIFKPRTGSDNAMISVYPFNDELYAFTESPTIHRVNSSTLETEGKVDLFERVGIVNHTSHPHVVDDGSVYNLAMSVTSRGPVHNIVCFPNRPESSGASKMFDEAFVVASIPAKWPLYPSYMHTFGITLNYFIIVEQPLSVSVPKLIKNHFENEALSTAFKWYADQQTRIHVIARDTGKLTRTFYSEPFFYLHIINQYELFGHVVVDICCYKDPSMLACMYVDAMKNMQKMPDYAKMFRGRPLRFVLPLAMPTTLCSGGNLINLPNTRAKAYMDNEVIRVQPEMLCDLGCETPRINYESYLGRAYQYFYAISSDVDADNPGTVIKVDTKSKTTQTWAENNCYPSEPIFVAEPNAVDEDDGVVLCSLVWGQNETNKCGLLVLDAKNMREIGRVEFDTPGPVPKCLHGWFAKQNL